MSVRPTFVIRAVAVAAISLVVWSGAVPAQAKIAHDAQQTWGANGPVFSVERVGRRIFIGGAFTALVNPANGKTVPRRHVAALTADGRPVLKWHPRVNGDVDALAASPDGTRLYLGGSFTRVNGISRGRLAAVKTDHGALLARWKPRANDEVLALAATADHVYVGGSFSSINGKARAFVAAVHARRGLLWSWDPGTNGPVRTLAMAPSGSSVYLGGSFFIIDHTQRHELARVTARSGEVAAWHPDPAVPVFGIQPTKDLVYVAAGGNNGGNLFAYAVKGGALAWKAISNGDFHSVTMFAGRVVTGGHFLRVRGQLRIRLAAFGPTTGKLSPWNPAATGNDNGVWTVLGGRTLEVVGYFTGINSRPQPGFAQFGRT